MVYTKKKYLKEIETNLDWEVEPHFYYYSLRRIFKYIKTAIENKMTPKDLQSALYGEFVIENKPILEGFIQDLNSNVKLVHKIIMWTQKETNV